MIKRKEKSIKYDFRKAIVHKLSRNQLFLLCIIALLVLALIGIFSPTALLSLM